MTIFSKMLYLYLGKPDVVLKVHVSLIRIKTAYVFLAKQVVLSCLVAFVLSSHF